MCEIKEKTNELITQVFDSQQELCQENLEEYKKRLKELLDQTYTLNKQMQISKNYLQNDVSAKLKELETIMDLKIKAKKDKIKELKVSNKNRKFHLYMIYMVTTVFGAYLLTYVFFCMLGYAN